MNCSCMLIFFTRSLFASHVSRNTPVQDLINSWLQCSECDLLLITSGSLVSAQQSCTETYCLPHKVYSKGGGSNTSFCPENGGRRFVCNS
jgi:hypothetical protein